MNIGIVVAVSEYVGKLANLPGCRKDGETVSSILRATSKFDAVLSINDATESASVKGKLIEFINGHKSSEIEEVFFYYSGHGEFTGDEFYYLLSDFEGSRRKQTALENTELDNLLRAVKPGLTVKVVDACQSGVPYIKDLDSFGKYLKGSQQTFKKCYFLFSSQTEEGSYQNESLSFFTQSFAEAILKHSGTSIRYKDIIDYISDSFGSDSRQTPFFVAQADFTEQFCAITDGVRGAVERNLASAAAVSVGAVVSGSAVSLKELVEQEAEDYCSEADVNRILGNLASLIEEYQHPGEAEEMFEIEVRKDSEYVGVPKLDVIGRWLREKEHTFFAEPVVRKQRVEKRVGYWDALTKGRREGERYVETVMKTVGIRPTVDMPFDHIVIKAKPRFPNLHAVGCFVVPIVSKTHVRLFTAFVNYADMGWSGEVVEGDIRWLTDELELKDESGFRSYLGKTFDAFWRFALDAIKKKFGLLPAEEAKESSKGGDTPEKGSEERKD